MTAEVGSAQDKRQSSVKPSCLCILTCVIGVALIDTSKDGMERLVVKKHQGRLFAVYHESPKGKLCGQLIHDTL